MLLQTLWVRKLRKAFSKYNLFQKVNNVNFSALTFRVTCFSGKGTSFRFLFDGVTFP